MHIHKHKHSQTLTALLHIFMLASLGASTSYPNLVWKSGLERLNAALKVSCDAVCVIVCVCVMPGREGGARVVENSTLTLWFCKCAHVQ